MGQVTHQAALTLTDAGALVSGAQPRHGGDVGWVGDGLLPGAAALCAGALWRPNPLPGITHVQTLQFYQSGTRRHDALPRLI